MKNDDERADDRKFQISVKLRRNSNKDSVNLQTSKTH